MSPILVKITSRNDSDFESSNVSLKENKPDGVNPNSNDIDYYVRKNEGKIRWFSADCVKRYCMKNSVDNDVAQFTDIHTVVISLYLVLIITKYSLFEFLPSVHLRINKLFVCWFLSSISECLQKDMTIFYL